MESIFPARLQRPESPRHLSFEGLSHPIALRYQPEFLAKGGENLVYNIPNHSDVVVKLNKRTLLETFDIAEDLGISPTSTDVNFIAILREGLEHKRKTQQALREHFGREHVVPQKYFLQTVPLPHGIDPHLQSFRDFKPRPRTMSNVKESQAVITVQPRVRELSKPHLSPTSGIMEARRISDLYENPTFASQYVRITNSLMTAESATLAQLTTHDFASFINHSDVTKLLEHADTDDQLRDVLRDFIERAVSFAEQTGEIIDFGKDNIIFTKDENDQWTYRVIDGFYGLQEDVLAIGKEALRKTHLGKTLTNTEQNAMLQAVNFTRTVNGIGNLVGAKKFYSLQSPDQRRVSEALGVFFPLLKKHSEAA